MTESGYFSIRLHSFLLTLLGPMFLLLGQRSDPINLGHKSLIKNTFSPSAWLFCATYILEIFSSSSFTPRQNTNLSSWKTPNTQKNLVKILHARILVTSQILSRFLADCTTTQWWKSSQSVHTIIQSQKLVKWQHSYHVKVFSCLKIDFDDSFWQWVDLRKSLALDNFSRFSPLCTSW